MRDLKEFTIPFVGLKLGEHHFDFIIDNTFFEHFEYDEFNGATISLDVLLDKKTTFMEFTLTYKGDVNVNCDVTNESYNESVAGSYHFIVKFISNILKQGLLKRRGKKYLEISVNEYL